MFKKKKKKFPLSIVWEDIVSFFLNITDANMLCRLFDDRKYMNIYLPIY